MIRTRASNQAVVPDLVGIVHCNGRSAGDTDGSLWAVSHGLRGRLLQHFQQASVLGCLAGAERGFHHQQCLLHVGSEDTAVVQLVIEVGSTPLQTLHRRLEQSCRVLADACSYEIGEGEHELLPVLRQHRGDIAWPAEACFDAVVIRFCEQQRYDGVDRVGELCQMVEVRRGRHLVCDSVAVVLGQQLLKAADSIHQHVGVGRCRVGSAHQHKEAVGPGDAPIGVRRRLVVAVHRQEVGDVFLVGLA